MQINADPKNFDEHLPPNALEAPLNKVPSSEAVQFRASRKTMNFIQRMPDEPIHSQTSLRELGPFRRMTVAHPVTSIKTSADRS
jgi:hypothetical protein